MERCAWCTEDSLYIAYHDTEWGVPVYEDNQLFELLNLEGMQAGLSWITILKKRAALREAFAGFDAHKLMQFTDADVHRLMQNEAIIRNRRKIEAVVNNAKAFLALQQSQSFADFIWRFVDGKPKQTHRQTMQDVPASTPESVAMAKALKQKGFKFVGDTICYAFMQAAGLVNDHMVGCYRYYDLIN